MKIVCLFGLKEGEGKGRMKEGAPSLVHKERKGKKWQPRAINVPLLRSRKGQTLYVSIVGCLTLHLQEDDSMTQINDL